MTKSRIFLYALVAFIAGVALRSFLIVPLTILWAGAVLAAAIFAVGITRRQKQAIMAALLILGFLGGILRFAYAEDSRPRLENLYQVMLTGASPSVEVPQKPLLFRSKYR